MLNLPLLLVDILPLDILGFILTLWLGMYLLKRNFQQVRLRLGGLSLILYACAACCFILATPASALRTPIIMVGQWLLLLSALLWAGALIYSLSEEMRIRNGLIRSWYFVYWPLIIICCGISLFQPSPLPLAVGLLPLLALSGLIWHTLQTERILLVASLVFVVVLAVALVWFPHTIMHLFVGLALLVPGFALAAQDATDQGEALLPDLLRSFDYAMLTALIFGAQATLLMLLGGGVTFSSLLLLQTTLTTAITIQVFSRTFVKLLDTIAFATFPQLKKERAELHTTLDVLPRIQAEVNLDALDDAEFIRLTRRALSHLGDLPRLASNPLTRLPGIKTRLRERGIKDEDVLEHAAELKTFLAESIERLKPHDKGDFGTSDEWRYYNALYFPYVMGIKPYSSRLQLPPSDPAGREALNWFRIQVPERTLHNWQNAAAKLVAQDLRNKKSSPPSKKLADNVKTGRT